MEEEEKKAIKEVKHFNELTRYWQEEEYEEEEIATYIKTVLNLIEKQQAEIEKKDKIIDAMAEIFSKISKGEYVTIERNTDTEKVIEYFTKKF